MRRTLLIVLGLCLCTAAVAQKKIGNGQVSGSFESQSIGYLNDKALGEAPEDHFGSNNYIKADYMNGRFSAGIQCNAFLPALQGYDDLADGFKFYLASKYIQWRDKNFEVLVGDIFDQYGNGLIYRSFEDRQLGLNNSIEGIRAGYNFGRFVAVKAMYGRPRLHTEYANSWVRGADLSISLADICGIQESTALSLEGSFVNRFQRLDYSYDGIDYSTVFDELGLHKPNLLMCSGRVNFAWNGLALHGEYVHKSKDLNSMAEMASTGYAIYGEASYNYKTFSITATYRQLNHMGTRVSLYDTTPANTLNYLPALTRQYTYMLANLEPYQVHSEGEMGGQVDVSYSLRSKSSRYRYWNFHANASVFYSTPTEFNPERKRLWLDINVDIERQWSKSWKTALLYTMQERTPYLETIISHTVVGDVTYKIDRKKSLRLELQYLHSKEYEGDWVAGLFEFNLAPSWSFFVSDMYNHGKTKVHYYNGGFSYTHSRTRIQLSYGRNRAGYVCSGGVCRYSPAYTGVNLMLTSSF